MGFARRILAVPTARRRLLVEAAWSLILARLMLRCLSFPRLAAYFSRRGSGAERTGAERDRLCRQVASAVDRMADVLPGSWVCFPRGIAAQAMLRRRRISTTLYYGARSEGALSAHVWIQDGDKGVLGMPAEGDYAVVATYPSENAPSD